MNDVWDPPADEVLGPALQALTPVAVLDACREQLRGKAGSDAPAWKSIRVIEALYHPQRYVRIAYALWAGETVSDRRAWPEAQIVYLHAPVREPMSRRGTIIRVGDVDVEAYRFPNDRRLRGMRKFTGREDATRVWQSWLDRGDSRVRIDQATLQRLLVRYVPEQKWVARLRAETRPGDGGASRKLRIAVRCSSPDSCATLLYRHVALTGAASESGAAPIVPRVVGASVEEGILAVEWNRGQSLIESLKAESPCEVMKELAAVVVSLHATSLPALDLITPRDIASAVREAAGQLALACPTRAAQVGSLVRELEDRLGMITPGNPVSLHNDLHFDQVRIKRGGITLLDLERMAVGDALIDVANLVTQLRMLGSRTEFAIEERIANRWANEFLHRWVECTAERVDGDRFRCYAVWSLLKLACGMMRHLRPGWRDLLDRCLEAAEGTLAVVGSKVETP